MTTLFYQPLVPEGVLYLDKDESRHCVKVLRKRAGDPITLTDGKGFFYEAVITAADPDKCEFQVRDKSAAPQRNYFIHIAIAPTKNADRMEWFVEKVTELGVDRITIMQCENSERNFIRTGRLHKVAVSAMKQSMRAALPTLDDRVVPFGEVVAGCGETEKCIAFVDPSNPAHLKDAVGKGSSYCVLIGPEGDFSARELTLALEHGFRKVSLGDSRLRTETAGMAACHILNLINS